ncbi:hypothetical protein GCK72_020018 [Caenorhabditis remanei]|uniref:G-protein coupled receptors family 1 profile domain-containing protein n=1 Tax=Caenorhabditis remanei TaxID=31234 RepID=A0A6A5GFV8_CAERE|nr:hypothetical protein GCK72_020018 [Caenorhabditis remanei]KAF1753461.1 hypothetical protein GCK72_020018 [Caenorhabditis remanei]
MHSTTFQLYFCPMVLLDSAEMKEWSHHCGFILLLCYELSVMIHLAISLNRFTAVWAPYEYQTIFSNKHTKIMIAAIWIFTGTVAFLFYEKSCHFYYEEKIHFLTFTSSKFCGYIGWYGDFLKNASIVAVVVSIDMLTVFKVRKMSKKVVANISDQSQHRMSCREMRFLKQTVTQGSVFMLELLTYFFVPQYFENKWVVFFATSFAWVAVHAVDGSIKSISLYSCKIPFEGKDPNVIGYLCAVDRCIHDFFQETEYDRFELMWRKLPDSLNWCATNAQMSVTKFTSKKEVMMFKVKNMMEKKNMEIGERCTAVVISFDNDDSLRDLDLEKILKTCTVHDVEFSSARIQGLANVLKSFNSAVIDLLIVGPSKASSYLLFQQFLGDYYDYLPTLYKLRPFPTACPGRKWVPGINATAAFREKVLVDGSK